MKNYVRAFMDHRLEREKQILDCLSQGYSLIKDMVPVMYTETDPSLYGAAAGSVFAAMIRLVDVGKVVCEGELLPLSEFRVT